MKGTLVTTLLCSACVKPRHFMGSSRMSTTQVDLHPHMNSTKISYMMRSSRCTATLNYVERIHENLKEFTDPLETAHQNHVSNTCTNVEGRQIWI